MDGRNPELTIKSTGDSQASLEEMLLTRYIKTANLYQKEITHEEELIKKINQTLDKQTEVEITNALSKVTLYYNFASYSILACLLLIISLILSSFNEKNIRKRIVISNTNNKKHNRILLASNCCYSLILWLFYVVISFVVLGHVMMTNIRNNIHN